VGQTAGLMWCRTKKFHLPEIKFRLEKLIIKKYFDSYGRQIYSYILKCVHKVFEDKEILLITVHKNLIVAEYFNSAVLTLGNRKY
jgi:hypothetical protein